VIAARRSLRVELEHVGICVDDESAAGGRFRFGKEDGAIGAIARIEARSHEGYGTGGRGGAQASGTDGQRGLAPGS